MLEEIASAIKAKITFEENENEFWDELPTHVQKGILEAKTQVEEGNYKVHEEVMNEYKTRFK
jgi:TRAP-type C4-dicarboxylate transport system substrate-binding protein